ncbi:MAG: serine hydrolase [Bacteroidota bacterium]
MKSTKILLLICLLSTTLLHAQENVIEQVLKAQPTYFKQLTDNPSKYKLQILYTQIDRDADNHAHFTTHAYRVDAQEYFYPASTVKLAASVLALEKINRLKIDKSTTFQTLKNRPTQVEILTDTNAANGKPSIEHYIKKILLVSDNEAYNRLYEFLGQQDFNKTMASKGFEGVRFTHRLQTSIPLIENQYTNPVQFLNEHGELVWQQKEKFNKKQIIAESPIILGKGIMNDSDRIIPHPVNFSFKNAYPLQAQHDFLKRLMFPGSFKKSEQFKLTPKDYSFIYRYMSEYPTESQYPNYSTDSTIGPAYCKFLYYGGGKKAVMNPNVRIFNKVGDAYGFLLDNAYFVDFKNGVEFILTATIYCNEDEIFNDDQYDYEDIGFPFFTHLGEVFYQKELNRPKKNLPNLDYLKFNYAD